MVTSLAATARMRPVSYRSLDLLNTPMYFAYVDPFSTGTRVCLSLTWPVSIELTIDAPSSTLNATATRRATIWRHDY